MTAFPLSHSGSASPSASNPETTPDQGFLNNLTIRLRSSQAVRDHVEVPERIQEEGEEKEKNQETNSKNKPTTEETNHVPKASPGSTPSIFLAEYQNQVPPGWNTIQSIGSLLVSTHAATMAREEERDHPYSSARFHYFKSIPPVVENVAPFANYKAFVNEEALVDNRLANHGIANDEPLASWDESPHSDPPTAQPLLPPLGQRAHSLTTVTNDNPLANGVVASWDPCAHPFNPENPDMIPELDRPVWTLADEERAIARIVKWREGVKAAEGQEMEKENMMCRGVWVNVDLEVSEAEWVEISRKKRREFRFPKGEEGAWDRTAEILGRIGMGNVE